MPNSSVPPSIPFLFYSPISPSLLLASHIQQSISNHPHWISEVKFAAAVPNHSGGYILESDSNIDVVSYTPISPSLRVSPSPSLCIPICFVHSLDRIVPVSLLVEIHPCHPPPFPHPPNPLIPAHPSWLYWWICAWIEWRICHWVGN